MLPVYLVFVPGIGSLADVWWPTVPRSVRLAPVEYRPSAADIDISVPEAQRSWLPGREPGGPGDSIEVAALRTLVVCLRLARMGERWSLAGHSSGGPVVYRSMELLLDLMGEPGAFERISNAATAWLPAEDAEELRQQLRASEGRPLAWPFMAMSFEGTLMPTDVQGGNWAEEMSKPETPRPGESEASVWERKKEATLAASLQVRSTESPPRHLASIRRWLASAGGDARFVYVAGNRSTNRNAHVFPALERVLAESGAPRWKLEIDIINNSQHLMYQDNPAATRRLLAHLFGTESAELQQQ